MRGEKEDATAPRCCPLLAQRIVQEERKPDAGPAQLYRDILRCRYDVVVRQTKAATRARIREVYLQGDGAALDHWIRTANQVGICVLKIFERVHVRRFAELNIGTKIDVLSRGL
jgi:hypothetical protein